MFILELQLIIPIHWIQKNQRHKTSKLVHLFYDGASLELDQTSGTLQFRAASLKIQALCHKLAETQSQNKKCKKKFKKRWLEV